MQLTRNYQLEAALLDKVTDYLRKNERDGIHASDLSAPLRAYWQKMAPLPATSTEAGYWLTGLGHHYYMVLIMTGVPDSQEASCFSEVLGIHYSPDLKALYGEFKTSRLSQEPADEQEALKWFSGYINQCKTYAVAEGVMQWNLFVLFIAPLDMQTRKKRAPFTRAYTFTFTDEELTRHREWIISTRKKLELALSKKDPSKLPLCEEYLCLRWVGQGRGKPRIPVAECKWFEHCKPSERYALVQNPPTKFQRQHKKG